jgi:hypothetical protein
MNIRKFCLNTTIGLSVILSSIVVYNPLQAISAPVIRLPKSASIFKQPKEIISTLGTVVSTVSTVHTLYSKVIAPNGQAVTLCQDIYSNGTRSNRYPCR